MGYLYTILPVCIVAGFGFLCYYWLGMMGVAMGVCGIAILIPYFMILNLYSALMNISSVIGYANNSSNDTNDTVINNLSSLNGAKKHFEAKILLHYNFMAILLVYLGVGVFVQQYFHSSNN